MLPYFALSSKLFIVVWSLTTDTLSIAIIWNYIFLIWYQWEGETRGELGYTPHGISSTLDSMVR